MQNSNKKTKKYIYGAIFDFALNANEMSDEEIRCELEHEGIDVDNTLTNIMQRVNKHIHGKKSWKEIALEKKKSFLNVGEKISESTRGKSSDVINLLRQMIASGELQVQHRDFSSMSDDDLMSLLEDIEILRAINESNKKS